MKGNTDFGTFVFVHVPKTGGSTFRQILSNRFDRIYEITGSAVKESLDTYKSLGANERNSYELVSGHLTLKLIQWIEQPRIMTFLRDPVDQFLSGYYYIKGNPHSRNHEEVRKLDHIREYFDVARRLGIDNQQTRHLSNATDFLIDTNTSPDDMRRSGELLLKRAKDNLKKFEFIFRLAQFDEALIVLKYELGWEGWPFYILANKTKDRRDVEEVSDSLREEIKEVNKYDMKLYEYGKVLNEQKMDQYDIASQVSRFKKLNAFYDRMGRPLKNLRFQVKKMLKRFIQDND